MDASAAMAMTMAQTPALQAPSRSANYQAAHKAAVTFEGQFISQMLSPMFDGISTDGPFGGGQGEAMFRSLMIDQYGKQIAQQGGFGLANAVTRALLIHQEVKS